MGRKISVLGSGSWGTALAIILAQKGFSVDLWCRNEEQRLDMKHNRQNSKYLKGVYLPENIEFSSSIENSVFGAESVVLATPSSAVRETCNLISPYIDEGKIIINVAKGIEPETSLRMSEIVSSEIPHCRYAILSGPSHAEEVSAGMPTTIIASSVEHDVAIYVQELFMVHRLRVYTNPDVVGVELGGSLKNIIAIAAGITDGLGYGDNTKAALMTRGIVEIGRLGVRMGAKPQTFAGLSGIGDLITTCTSMHSRNRRAGILIGQGKSVEQTLREIGMVVEGVRATDAAYRLSTRLGVPMPITEELYAVLFRGKDVKKCLADLMERERTSETEEIVDENYTW